MNPADRTVRPKQPKLPRELTAFACTRFPFSQDSCSFFRDNTVHPVVAEAVFFCTSSDLSPTLIDIRTLAVRVVLKNSDGGGLRKGLIAALALAERFVTFDKSSRPFLNLLLNVLLGLLEGLCSIFLLRNVGNRSDIANYRTILSPLCFGLSQDPSNLTTGSLKTIFLTKWSAVL